MIVGAGTVLSVQQAETAVKAGSKFIVSPGLNPKVVTWCQENKVPVLPGCTTPTEIEQAIELGLDTVKFFPAEQSGGLAKIKAMAAPYTNMKFMPTGGISLENMNEYLSFNKIIACGGSFMVKNELIDNCDFESVTSLTKNAVKKMLDFKIAHIGINGSSAEEAQETGKLYSLLSDCPAERENDGGFFIGNEFEFLKFHGRGTNGHIAISTPNTERAVFYLEKRGFTFNWDSAQYDKNGVLKVIYLDGELGGFGVHLIEKQIYIKVTA